MDLSSKHSLDRILNPSPQPFGNKNEKDKADRDRYLRRDSKTQRQTSEKVVPATIGGDPEGAPSGGDSGPKQSGRRAGEGRSNHRKAERSRWGRRRNFAAATVPAERRQRRRASVAAAAVSTEEQPAGEGEARGDEAVGVGGRKSRTARRVEEERLPANFGKKKGGVVGLLRERMGRKMMCHLLFLFLL